MPVALICVCDPTGADEPRVLEDQASALAVLRNGRVVSGGHDGRVRE